MSVDDPARPAEAAGDDGRGVEVTVVDRAERHQVGVLEGLDVDQVLLVVEPYASTPSRATDIVKNGREMQMSL